ncbi:Core-2/I-Branching enzyme [Ancylostoma duodenale]|uniref:Core-2/I-Branching enzyme n=1 Tax=Ancylostoma duodenale TaxID=51022 RepID=A0A0C2H730_9BILA|nr:Core-2/I-Branching enzyme [Ancylostoma duodenale]
MPYSFNMSKKVEGFQPSYRPLRRLETAHVDCGRVLNGDKDYIASIAKNRPVLIHKNEERSCEMIRHSIVPPTQMKKMMFGVAFARVVYRNHDVIIKSPYEMVEIYKLLEGANDIEISPCPEDRLDQSRQWDARSLNLFRDESAMTPKQLSAQLTFAKGAAQASLSRPAVEWLVNTANLTNLMNQLNEKQFGVDEILMESLQVSDDLDMPGRFTSECLMRGLNTPFISRSDISCLSCKMSIWEYDDAYRCRSKYSRKSICILGIEDLQTLSQYPHLMANKVKFNRNRKRPDANYKLECE